MSNVSSYCKNECSSRRAKKIVGGVHVHVDNYFLKPNEEMRHFCSNLLKRYARAQGARAYQ